MASDADLQAAAAIAVPFQDAINVAATTDPPLPDSVPGIAVSPQDVSLSTAPSRTTTPALTPIESAPVPISTPSPTLSAATPPPTLSAATPPPRGSTSSPTSSSAGTSQWGSFIKRAVTTVEQSLDKVLDPSMASEAHIPPATPATDRSGQRISMQQRLALAMQAQKAQKAGAGIARRPTPGSSSVESSTRPSMESTRPSIEESQPASEKESERASEFESEVEDSTTTDTVESTPAVPQALNAANQQTAASTQNQESTADSAAADALPSASDVQLRTELAQKQEDLHSSLSRITILEEKVKYLSNQLLDYTQKKGNQNHIDTRLAEKDEKIALLLLEGETLSKNELKHMTTIKRLRAAEKESERQAQEAKRRQERAEKESADLRERLRKANEIERKQSERIKILAKSDSEVDILKRERDTLKDTISDLRAELTKANLLADDAVQKAQTEALDKEKTRAESLAQQLEALKAERALEQERFTHEKFNLQSKLSRESDRSQTREHELREEISSLEHRLEMLRIQAEELSAGATGDTQAKMLRQVETLQSQYAIATENWHGIEASLQSRIASLENDRDEVAKRDATLRKKLHEESSRVRESEQEIEAVTSRASDLEAELQLQSDLVASLRKRIDEETARFTSAIKELEKDKTELEQRLLEEEKARREETIMQLRSPPALSSPTFSKNGTSPGYFAHQNGGRNFSLSRESSSYNEWFASPSAANSNSGSINVPTSIEHRRVSRTTRAGIPSIQTNHSFSPSHSAVGTPVMSSSASFVSLAELSSSSAPQQINMQNNMFRGRGGGSGDSTGGSNPADELASNASTAIGGVSSSERMSTVIRRLSSELASAKEELAILARDRDQAREEIVELLREVRDKRDVEAKCTDLQKQMDDLRLREQTTLELLGEKTERVNELEDDVADLKMMYRQQIQELIERVNQKAE
ncbi:TATA element modulatory factor 1 TATA binding-domain-containing protein [Lipomyces tetrasporus]|uniref:TATA element modulatory factor 1 TATA binding-domain-containing protein n=1 Tax=Lipomyces tetrasporus TaxID=54092 RepID=A0AAD7VRX7_9ASCO|nr:TATA element modulatory factor 1 TATA binding-domain-containing protein [Lipomyces tetrasporus]KAJ8099401.1 TATA element modulatory factor 1 TATA binding-domain-containing protein [Lipomyces tetrasporus]